MYYIIEFVTQKEVAIVHQSWIVNKTVYYPDFWKNGIKLTSALVKGQAPNKTSWLQYNQWRVVGNKFFATYDLAKRMLTAASDGSDFSSNEAPLPRLRKRKCTANSGARGSESSDDDHQPNSQIFVTPKGTGPKSRRLTPVVTLPPVPTPPPETTPAVGSQSTFVAVADLEGMTNHDALHGCAPIITEDELTGILHNSSAGSNLTTLADNTGRSVGVTAIPDNTSDQTSYPDRVSSSNFVFPKLPAPEFDVVNGNGTYNADIREDVKILQSNQTLILAKLDMLLDFMNTTARSRAMDHRSTSDVDPSLPLDQKESFNSLENGLKASSDKRRDLAAVLCMKGGNTPNQVVHRVMSALMTDELMVGFTFAGQSGKKSFKNTMVLSVICDAVRRTEKGSIASDKEIEKAVEYWLKKASTRMKCHQKST